MRLRPLAAIMLWSMVSCSPKTNQNVVLLKNGSIMNGHAVEKSDVLSKSIVGVFNLKTQSLCTGSLLPNNLVLTAAHCAPSKASHVKIIFSNDIDSTINSLEPDVKQETMLTVTDFKVANGYDPKNNDESPNKKDIALMKFKGVVPMGFAPAMFLSDNSLLRPGANVVVAGLGVNEVKVKKIDPATYKGLSEAIDYGEVICEEENGKRGECFQVDTLGDGILRMAEAPIRQVYESEIELDETKAGTCVGDSGGPAYLKINGSYYLFGVTSRGSAFCNETGVYTNALSFSNWIKETGKVLK